MRLEVMAEALLADIERHLPEAAFFQREDLLHLPAFQGVATITRYRYVCAAVDQLLWSRKLVAKGRSDLCLSSRSRDYRQAAGDLSERYGKTVLRLVQERKGNFHVMDIVRDWTSDQHLTENTKRIAARGALKRLVREGALVSKDGMSFLKQRSKTYV